MKEYEQYRASKVNCFGELPAHVSLVMTQRDSAFVVGFICSAVSVRELGETYPSYKDWGMSESDLFCLPCENERKRAAKMSLKNKYAPALNARAKYNIIIWDYCTTKTDQSVIGKSASVETSCPR